MGKQRLAANRKPAAVPKTVPAAEQTGEMVHMYIARQQTAHMAATADRIKAAAAVGSMATVPATESISDAKRAKIYLAYCKAAEQEKADAIISEQEQANELLRKQQAERRILSDIVTVWGEKKETEQYVQKEYKRILIALFEKLQSAAEISDWIISTDKHWPMNDKHDKRIGIDSAAKSLYAPALGLKDFNVWRSNYCRGFVVLTKQLVTLFKRAESLVKNLQYADNKGLLERAINTADNQGHEEAVETLKAAIEIAENAHTEKVETEQAAEQAEQAEKTLQLAATVTNLETASLARVLQSVLQLADNKLLNKTEQALILAAGDKLQERVKIAAEQAKTEKEQAEQKQAEQKQTEQKQAEQSYANLSANEQKTGTVEDTAIIGFNSQSA